MRVQTKLSGWGSGEIAKAMRVGAARVWYPVCTAHNTTCRFRKWSNLRRGSTIAFTSPPSKFESVRARVIRCVPIPGNQYNGVISSYIALYSTRRHRNVKEKKTSDAQRTMTAARPNDQRIRGWFPNGYAECPGVVCHYRPLTELVANDGRQSFFFFAGRKAKQRTRRCVTLSGYFG
jgi:hypothetical protein